MDEKETTSIEDENNKVESKKTKAKEPRGFGGWLLLPAIGLSCLPIREGVMLFTEIIPSFNPNIWKPLTTPGSDVYHPLWGPIIIFDALSTSLLILFNIVVLYFFYRKKAIAPTLVIILFAVFALLAGLELLSAELIPTIEEEFVSQTWATFIRQVIFSLLWIGYFRKSKRVKNTFQDKQNGEPATEMEVTFDS